MGPYNAADLPESVSATTTSSEVMTTVITAGNFTMISNTAEPPRTYTSQRLKVWTSLKQGEQAGILVGVYLVVLGLLVGVALAGRRRSRWLEDPLNPAYHGQVVVGPDGRICFKPNASQGPNPCGIRSFHVRKQSDLGSSSTHPLLNGAGDR